MLGEYRGAGSGDAPSYGAASAVLLDLHNSLMKSVLLSYPHFTGWETEVLVNTHSLTGTWI